MASVLEVDLVNAARDSEAEQLSRFLDRCRSSFAQQTLAWQSVVAPIGGDEPRMLVCRSGGNIVGLLPAYICQGPLGSILTSACQAGALGGVACDLESGREEVYEALLAAFMNLAKERGCALATIVSNPFWTDEELCRSVLKPDYALENSCQVLDLETAVDADGRFVNAASNAKRNLKKAEANDLLIDEAQTAENVDAWYELHAARHQQLGAKPLPKMMFTAALKEMVPRDKGRFFFIRLAREPNEMIAGGFYVYHGQVIDALMPSMRTDQAGLLPNFLLAAHTIRRAKARGLRYYNWQASPPAGGVHRFKRQWGSHEAVYYYFTRITGDVEPFHESTVAFVRDAYSGHYVMPFDKIGVDPGSTLCVSSRKDAWDISTGAVMPRPPDENSPSEQHRQQLKHSVLDHYESKLRKHGPTARGMDWKDEASQQLRFELLCGICDLNGKSIHEIGAGAGHLCDFLCGSGINADYSGSDLSPAMVDEASRRHPHIQFDQRDILLDAGLPTYDVVVCSGLFHVMLDNDEDSWCSFVYDVVRRMYAMSRVGIAFNIITDHVDFRAENLYYSNPGRMLNFCRSELSRYTVIRHDYTLFEYTTYVYRNSTN